MSRRPDREPEREERFLGEMGRWTSRPPELSARLARQRVLASLPRRRSAARRFAFFGAGLATATAAALLALLGTAGQSTARIFGPVEGEFELSTGTPLFVVPTTASEGEPAER